MRILPFENVNKLAIAVEKELRRKISSQGPIRVFLPTGQSPLPLYALMRQDPKFWSTNLIGVQIDEFIHRSRPFYMQLQKELIAPLNLKISVWNPQWSDQEGQHYKDEILKHPIDVALLGLGPNGHVGFHEPGVPKTFEGGRVQVTESTRIKSNGPTTEVFTFGVGAFLRAQDVFLIVTGESKRDILNRFEMTDATEELPATLLKAHKSLTVYTDLN